MNKKKIKFIAFISLVICLLVGLAIYRSQERYKFDEAAYYPDFEQQIPLMPGDKALLKRGSDYAVLYPSDGQALDGNQVCAFFRARNAVLLTSQMILFRPAGDGTLTENRLSCFTEVEYSGSNCIVSRDDALKITEASFLYNGEDTIVLLQPAVIRYNGTEHKLSPLSYVITCYNNWVQYRDHSSGKYYFDYIELGDRVTVEIPEQGVSIFTDRDVVEYGGKEHMMVPFVSVFPDYLE